MHHCLNVVCGPEGEAAAVLIRALQPLEGLDLMRHARGLMADGGCGGAAPGGDARLTAGPARLCQALGIDRSLDGLDLLSDDRLRLVGPPRGEVRLEVGERVVAGPRVGVAYAGPEWGLCPWRFGIADHGSLSRPFRGS
jgi:DNA-3-methyladenine glycosylase